MRQKLLYVIIALLPVVILSCAPATMSPEDGTLVTTPQEEPQKELEAVEVGNWWGETDKNTPPFQIYNSPWVINWVFMPEQSQYGPSANFFSITAMRPDGEYVDLVVSNANAEKTIQEQSYVYETGIFYLDIDCFGGAWDITVVAFE